MRTIHRMRVRKLMTEGILSTASILILQACQPASLDVPLPPHKATKERADSEYLGQSLKAASANADRRNLRWRIVQIDGRSRPVTKDYRPDRLNFSVANGIIIRVTKG